MRKKRVNPARNDLAENIETCFSSWLAQAANMMMPRNLDAILGRGSAKTTEFQVERLIEMIYDMPGAPVAWVADTYSNLAKNVLPMVLEGLERKKMKEGVHYVVESPPPSFTEAEKAGLPAWLKPHFWRPFNKVLTYKHTMIFFTGLNLTFGSLDRPASLAGKSYVHVFGDEVKYFKESKIANLMKAVRGYAVQYGDSPFYRGHTFTTDMPDTSNIGEYDWILRQGKRMDVNAMVLLLQTALTVNEIKHEIVALSQAGRTAEARTKRALLERWEDRLRRMRKDRRFHNLFLIASSFVNVDILTPEWFADAFESELSDVNTAILSLRPKLEGGNRFYAALGDKHFFRDGTDETEAENMGLRDEEDCRLLRYLNPTRSIDIGVDFGNMCSLIVAQDDGKSYRLLKTLYTLSPEYLPELGDKFRAFFAPHKEKTVYMYYDRAGNNLKKAGQDLASKLKEAIETDRSGKRTGWKVVLMSIGQGNIRQNEEYMFMGELLSGHNKRLPKVLIDFYNCKPLRCSLEITPTRINDKGQVVKDKRSEKLPIHRLPLESSNFSDAFKYLMMRRSWLAAFRSRAGATEVGTPSVRG